MKKILFAIFAAVVSFQAHAELKYMDCQYRADSLEAFRVLEIDGNEVRFFAQDDDVEITDFQGELTRLNPTDLIEVEAKTKGLEAWRFLHVKADTVNKTIQVEQSELKTDTVTYHCAAIRFRL